LFAESESDRHRDRAALREARRQTRWARRGTVIGAISLIVTCGIWAASRWPSVAERPPDPITIVTQLDADCGADWFTHRRPEDIDFGKINDIFPDWSQVPEAIPANPLITEATIQGRTRAQVSLTGMDIEIRKRRPPPVGTVLATNGCGDIGNVRTMNVDLDTDPPRVSTDYNDIAAEESEASAANRRPIEFPYNVAIDDLETFEISSTTTTCDCEWVALLHWRSEGHAGTTIVDDHGKPFRTIATAAASVTCDGTGACR
jgi:hypothetical protein